MRLCVLVFFLPCLPLRAMLPALDLLEPDFFGDWPTDIDDLTSSELCKWPINIRWHDTQPLNAYLLQSFWRQPRSICLCLTQNCIYTWKQYLLSATEFLRVNVVFTFTALTFNDLVIDLILTKYNTLEYINSSLTAEPLSYFLNSSLDQVYVWTRN